MSLLYDITNRDVALESLARLLRIETACILEYITMNPEEYSINDFIEFVDVDMDDFCIDDIEMVMVHITTNNDRCSSIKKYGLLNLQQALTMNTPLKQHLKMNKIEFDIFNKIICINHQFHEFKYDRETNKHQMSERQKSINSVARKVYFDHQINGFFCVRNYKEYGGRVHERPEFINDIVKLFRKGQRIEDEWKECSQEYLVKVKAPIEHFTWYNFYPSESSYGDDYENKEELKNWLICKAILVIWSDYHNGELPNNILAYLKPEVIIPISDIINIK